MPWFKVDDGLATNADVLRIPRAARMAALGLWVIAGSWSARELTDGLIERHMLEELAGTDEQAAWLVSAGIWAVVDDGWQFVRWEPDQPLREPTLAKRAANTQRVSKWRSGNKVGNAVTGQVANVDVTPPPSRPVPTRPDKDKKLVHPSAELTSAFELWWSIYPRKQAKADALKAYVEAHKKIGAEKLLAAVRIYALAMAGEDKTFVKLGGGWLRSERWTDEPLVRERPAAPARVAAECDVHDGYPLPCESCRRIAELPEGAPF